MLNIPLAVGVVGEEITPEKIEIRLVEGFEKAVAGWSNSAREALMPRIEKAFAKALENPFMRAGCQITVGLYGFNGRADETSSLKYQTVKNGTLQGIHTLNL
jgi:hypothetical protein